MTNADYEELWNNTLDLLKSELGEEVFGGWFTDIKYLRSGEKSIFVGFPSAFHRDRVKTRYQKNITAKLKEQFGEEISLEFEVIPDNEAKNSGTELKTNENTDTVTEIDTPDGVSTEEKPEEKQKKKPHSQLRDDYTFERFIIGENNNYAANAAIAISRNPGTAYNPFFIYGGVGLGKTHLMQAIGNSIHENSGNNIIYVTSEDFLNEYVQAIREKEMPAFKNKFRYTDVLLIDDIQFLQDKEGIQEEFFHTFNTLINAKKQLVMTCDRPHTELKLSDRLINRFELGLRVDLQPPRYEMRVAILESTAKNRGTDIPDEVIDLISKNISSNVRDLIGALNTLISYTEIMNQPITLEIARQKLRDLFASRTQKNLSIEIIQKAVTDFYRISSTELKGKKRNQKIVFPRQVAMFLCREMTDYSTTEIGEEFGGRDHTTVIHSIDKIQGLLLTDPTIDTLIENLKRKIKEQSAKL